MILAKLNLELEAINKNLVAARAELSQVEQRRGQLITQLNGLDGARAFCEHLIEDEKKKTDPVPGETPNA
jgi:predicted  nucleic acid-binding Zn-ribbon protein